MSQFEKLVNKILQDRTPKDIMPDELRLILEHYSFYLNGTTGSHNVFKHQKLIDNYSIPLKRMPVKPAYIKKIKEALLELKEMEDE